MPAFQILDECPACHVESAVAAIYDPLSPASALGVAAESRCRLCGRVTVGTVEPACAPPGAGAERTREDACPRCGEVLTEEDRMATRCSHCGIAALSVERRPGTRFGSVDQLEEALAAWARAEGNEDTLEFVESSFLDGSLDAVFARLQSGERVETNFDVLAFLFPEVALAAAVPMELGPEEMAPPAGDTAGQLAVESDPGQGGTGSWPPVDSEPEPGATGNLLPVESESTGGDDPPAGDETDDERRPTTLEERTEAWAPMLPLVSVMVADGRVHPAEEAFLNRVLARHKVPPIPAAHVRVHRPETVPVSSSPRARERMVEAMVHLVHVDRLRDGTEFRVVEEYARAWGVDPAKVRHWDKLYRKRYATGTQRLWLILESIFVKR